MTAYKTDGSFRPAPPTSDEQAKVRQVMEVLAGMCSEESALNVLRRNTGDVEKTISALLDDPSSGAVPTPSASDNPPLPFVNEPRRGVRSRSPPPSRPEKPHMIDLTADDEDNDVQMALRASIEQIQPALQRSTRAPDPNWAMVASNVEVPGDGMSQDDQQMSQAIEASLNDELAMEQFEEKPLEERLRQGESPVILRSTSSAFTYAALILQALYYVPQIREAIARGLQEDILDESGVSTSGPDNAAFTVLETFVYLELSRMADLDADTALKAFETDHWPKHIESPGDISYEFYGKVSWAVETVLHKHLATDPSVDSWPRLFHFRHGPSGEPPVKGAFDRNLDTSIVRVPIPGTPEANDLLSCLRLEFRDDVIVSPSEVVAFQLVRLHHSGGERQRFSYPSSIYLDQFMHEKAGLANEKRRLQQELLADIDALREKQRALTKDKHGDALANLQSALYYYENIAEDEGDDMRRANLEDTAQVLRKIIAGVEVQLKGFESEIQAKKAEADRMMDCHELQEHKFDLRAVLVHDGYYGRNHLYSYVRDKNKWWKVLEQTTSEVSEDDVLTDTIGLHLRAGPYMLIYGRSISLEEEARRPPWPENLKDSVKECNIALFHQLGPKVPAGIVDPNSPPTTVLDLPSEPMSETSSLAVEPPSRADSMDVGH